MNSWIRLDPTDPTEMARLADFIIDWWSESLTTQAKADNDWTAAEVTSALRLIKAKVLGMSGDELVGLMHRWKVSGTTH